MYAAQVVRVEEQEGVKGVALKFLVRLDSPTLHVSGFDSWY